MEAGKSMTQTHLRKESIKGKENPKEEKDMDIDIEEAKDIREAGSSKDGSREASRKAPRRATSQGIVIKRRRIGTRENGSPST